MQELCIEYLFYLGLKYIQKYLVSNQTSLIKVVELEF
jgi:hypothetical protein